MEAIIDSTQAIIKGNKSCRKEGIVQGIKFACLLEISKAGGKQAGSHKYMVDSIAELMNQVARTEEEWETTRVNLGTIVAWQAVQGFGTREQMINELNK